MKNEVVEVIGTAVSTTSSSPVSLIEMAIKQNADVDKLEKLMELQERWDEKQAKTAFYEAFTNFQADMPTIDKKKSGHNCKYAPLSDIVEQIKPCLHRYGLSFRFEQAHSDGIEVTCVISHISGHSERTTMSAMADTSGSKNSVQAIASTVTYLSRYTLCSAFGITTADEDMDGRLPPPEIVSEVEAEEIKLLLKEVDADVKAFCKTFGCQSVDLLPAKSYIRARAMINAKRDK